MSGIGLVTPLTAIIRGDPVERHSLPHPQYEQKKRNLLGLELVTILHNLYMDKVHRMIYSRVFSRNDLYYFWYFLR